MKQKIILIDGKKSPQEREQAKKLDKQVREEQREYFECLELWAKRGFAVKAYNIYNPAIKGIIESELSKSNQDAHLRYPKFYEKIVSKTINLSEISGSKDAGQGFLFVDTVREIKARATLG